MHQYTSPQYTYPNPTIKAPKRARRSRSQWLVVIIVIAVIALLGLGLWAAFNGLIKSRNRTQEAWSEIDIELKRRHDTHPQPRFLPCRAMPLTSRAAIRGGYAGPRQRRLPSPPGYGRPEPNRSR